MNKKQWQQELQEITLSTAQKQKMKQVVENVQPKKQITHNWTFVVVPAFILLLIFSSRLLLFTEAPTDLQQAAQPPIAAQETEHRQFITLHMSLNIAISLLIVSTVALLMLVIVKTKRWQGVRIRKIRQNLMKTRYLQLFFGGVFMYSNTLTLAALMLSVRVQSMLIYSVLVMLVVFLALYSARHLGEPVCCPHCAHEFSIKKKRRLMLYFKLDLRCFVCDGKLFYAKKTRQASGVLSMVILPFILLPANFGIPLWYVLLVGGSAYFAVFYYLLPLFLLLEGDEKPLF